MDCFIAALAVPVLLRPGGNRQATHTAKRLRYGDFLPAALVVHQAIAAFKRVSLTKVVITARGVAIAGEAK